jgi:hypothetical protein
MLVIQCLLAPLSLGVDSMIHSYCTRIVWALMQSRHNFSQVIYITPILAPLF